ncbi:MAG: formate dehydrogenase accessory sulfurtransferase FdhD [Acidimicrobiia bacterium]|nr:formate dehydrogenase accessory sulfurtransferase FdhD [Acidimicrobiia bacterium]
MSPTHGVFAAAVARVQVVRMRDGRPVDATDYVAVEAPLQVRIGGVPFATIMRTPGQDRELAAGFLFAERVLRHPDDLGTIEHCVDTDASHPENIVNVGLTGASAAAAAEALAGRRAVVASSACGVCGRRSIEELATDCVPVEPVPDISGSVIAALPAALRRGQSAFQQTGGLHAAGLFATDGSLIAAAEDVGRHNAVDKVVGGRVLRDELPLRNTLLCVSGRTSFEIVQKAWAAGIPCVVAVSAPSSLAIEVAEAAGITLVGFARDGGFNTYTGQVGGSTGQRDADR